MSKGFVALTVPAYMPIKEVTFLQQKMAKVAMSYGVGLVVDFGDISGGFIGDLAPGVRELINIEIKGVLEPYLTGEKA